MIKSKKRLWFQIFPMMVALFIFTSSSGMAKSKPVATYGRGKATLVVATGSPGALGLLKAQSEPLEGKLGVKPNDSEIKGKVVIFHAGSLTLPLYKMEKAFEAAHPGVDIVREAAGSRTCARKIVDLKRPCDIMISADDSVIDRFLIPTYADFNIRFASNQMVICYTEQSRYHDKITANNWYKVLQDKKVIWGQSDPNFDPCGYRALMVMQLAEKYYKVKGLYKALLSNRPLRNIRPKSVELVALLQAGAMDYAWEYRSVAVQHQLKFVQLPDEINLGSTDYNDFYRQAMVEISGKKPGEKVKKTGKAITYGVTILKNAKNRAGAIAFLRYLLDPKGGASILKKNGQPPLVPAWVKSASMLKKIPAELRKWVVVK